VAFLLLNKVSSPQYTLWLLPFLALLRVHWAWWAAFTVADALVYVGVFRWFHALVSGTDASLPATVLETGVWGSACCCWRCSRCCCGPTSSRVSRPSDRT
jgi:hypothetical protein